ncbi:MAG: PAS domain S-box protein [Bacteroidetes bacterium]|nr:PAS domain S-box protein [Bacteroidota bacterium]
MDLEILKIKLAESQKKQKELESQVEELSDFIENASLPLHWVNGSGIIIWANKVELDFLGYSKEEYVGKHISNFHADKNIIEDIMTRLIKKETLKNYPAKLKCKNGKIKPVLINSNVFWKEDKFIHTRCFTRDISELQKLEERKVEQILALENKNRALKLENASLKQDLNFIKNN